MVSPLVLRECLLTVVHFVAKVAGVHSFLPVRFCQMLVLERVGHEAFVAPRTADDRLLLVNYIHVHVFVMVGLEYFAADFTGMSLVVFMPFQMRVQSRFLEETHAAYVASVVAEVLDHMRV